MHFEHHPNCPDLGERKRRAKYYWDPGVGIMYWSKRYGKTVINIPERYVSEGHCTRIGNSSYVVISSNDERRDISKDLPFNYNLVEVCERLGIAEFLGR